MISVSPGWARAIGSASGTIPDTNRNSGRPCSSQARKTGSRAPEVSRPAPCRPSGSLSVLPRTQRPATTFGLDAASRTVPAAAGAAGSRKLMTSRRRSGKRLAASSAHATSCGFTTAMSTPAASIQPRVSSVVTARRICAGSGHVSRGPTSCNCASMISTTLSLPRIQLMHAGLHPAVDPDALAGDETRGRRGEEAAELPDLVRLAEPAQRNAAQQALAVRRIVTARPGRPRTMKRLHTIGDYQARRDIVDGDASGAEFSGQALRQARDRRAVAIREDHGLHRLPRGYRRDDDDPRLGREPERRYRRADQVNHAHQRP